MLNIAFHYSKPWEVNKDENIGKWEIEARGFFDQNPVVHKADRFNYSEKNFIDQLTLDSDDEVDLLNRLWTVTVGEDVSNLGSTVIDIATLAFRLGVKHGQSGNARDVVD
jgi:hypothetical protein